MTFRVPAIPKGRITLRKKENMPLTLSETNKTTEFVHSYYKDMDIVVDRSAIDFFAFLLFRESKKWNDHQIRTQEAEYVWARGMPEGERQRFRDMATTVWKGLAYHGLEVVSEVPRMEKEV